MLFVCLSQRLSLTLSQRCEPSLMSPPDIPDTSNISLFLQSNNNFSLISALRLPFFYLLTLQHCGLYLFITFGAPRLGSSMVFISLDFSINQACFMAHWAALGPITFIWVEGKWDNKTPTTDKIQSAGKEPLLSVPCYDGTIIWATTLNLSDGGTVFMSVHLPASLCKFI